MNVARKQINGKNAAFRGSFEFLIGGGLKKKQNVGFTVDRVSQEEVSEDLGRGTKQSAKKRLAKKREKTSDISLLMRFSELTAVLDFSVHFVFLITIRTASPLSIGIRRRTG